MCRGLLCHRLQSFPSGHTAAAFSVGIFLSLYLNAKLKAFADYSAEFCSMVAVIAPIIGASIIGGGLLVDHVQLSLFFPLHSIPSILTFLTSSPLRSITTPPISYPVPSLVPSAAYWPTGPPLPPFWTTDTTTFLCLHKRQNPVSTTRTWT
jgi:PAP2 superfamily